MSPENASASPPLLGRAAPKRIVWVDTCKGIAIVLVVYGHVSGGLGVSGAVKADSFWIALREWVYLFHMSAFFALSGYFAPRMAKLSVRDFLIGRLCTVAYPYLIWTFIIVSSQFSMARYVNNPVDFHRAVRFLLEPYGYGLWFLYALFINSLFFYVLSRWIKPKLVILGLAMALAFLAGRNFFGFWPILNTAMAYFIFYVSAASIPEGTVHRFSASKSLQMLALGSGLLIAMTVLFYAGLCQTWFLSLLAAFLGIAGVVCLSQGLGRTRIGLFWAFLGAYSLEIYLGHPLWGTLARVVLERARIDSGAGLILGGLFIGVAGSLAMGVLCRACHFPWLFRWPAKKSAVAGSPAEKLAG